MYIKNTKIEHDQIGMERAPFCVQSAIGNTERRETNMETVTQGNLHAYWTKNVSSMMDFFNK